MSPTPCAGLLAEVPRARLPGYVELWRRVGLRWSRVSWATAAGLLDDGAPAADAAAAAPRAGGRDDVASAREALALGQVLPAPTWVVAEGSWINLDTHAQLDTRDPLAAAAAPPDDVCERVRAAGARAISTLPCRLDGCAHVLVGLAFVEQPAEVLNRTLSLIACRIGVDVSILASLPGSSLQPSADKARGYLPVWSTTGQGARALEQRRSSGSNTRSVLEPTSNAQHNRPKISILTLCVYPRDDGSLECYRVRGTLRLLPKATHLSTSMLERASPKGRLVPSLPGVSPHSADWTSTLAPLKPIAPPARPTAATAATAAAADAPAARPAAVSSASDEPSATQRGPTPTRNTSAEWRMRLSVSSDDDRQHAAEVLAAARRNASARQHERARAHAQSSGGTLRSSTTSGSSSSTYVSSLSSRQPVQLRAGSHAFVRCYGERFLRVGSAVAPFGRVSGHPALAAEGLVAYAGEVEVDEAGLVTRWSNMSGCYRPDARDAHLAALPMAKFWRVVQTPAARAHAAAGALEAGGRLEANENATLVSETAWAPIQAAADAADAAAEAAAQAAADARANAAQAALAVEPECLSASPRTSFTSERARTQPRRATSLVGRICATLSRAARAVRARLPRRAPKGTVAPSTPQLKVSIKHALEPDGRTSSSRNDSLVSRPPELAAVAALHLAVLEPPPSTRRRSLGDRAQLSARRAERHSE